MFQSLLACYSEKLKNDEGETIGYVYEELWTKYASNLLGKVFMYAALFLIAALVIVGIVTRLKKAENFSSYLKIAAAIGVSFALTVILTMLAVGFGKIGEKGYMQEKPMLLVLIPPMILAGIAILGGIASYISYLYSKKAGKTVLYVTFALFAAALIATFVCLIVYFNKNISNDGYYDTADGSYGKVNQLVLYLASALLIAVALIAAFLCDKKGSFTFDSKSIALAGICVSLSFALSYIKLWDLPQGGSVTLVSLLPVMLFSYIYGAKKGLFVCFVYGVLQSLQDPYIIHPAQFLLDYPVAFSMAGLAGVLKNVNIKSQQLKFSLSALIGGVLYGKYLGRKFPIFLTDEEPDAALVEQARLDKEREKNRNVSYRWWELIPMFLFAPFYMSYEMRRIPEIIFLLPVHLLSWTPVDFSGLFPELRRLKEEKYDLKFKQRLTALIFGDAMYFLLIYYSLLNDEVL